MQSKKNNLNSTVAIRKVNKLNSQWIKSKIYIRNINIYHQKILKNLRIIIYIKKEMKVLIILYNLLLYFNKTIYFYKK
jgi:hypothetical protein